jgi:hypothetical protein
MGEGVRVNPGNSSGLLPVNENSKERLSGPWLYRSLNPARAIPKTKTVQLVARSLTSTSPTLLTATEGHMRERVLSLKITAHGQLELTSSIDTLTESEARVGSLQTVSTVTNDGLETKGKSSALTTPSQILAPSALKAVRNKEALSTRPSFLPPRGHRVQGGCKRFVKRPNVLFEALGRR